MREGGEVSGPGVFAGSGAVSDAEGCSERARRRIGYNSLSGEYTRSRYFATFPHKNPRVTGCDGSPCNFTARPVASSTVTSTPQESGQSCEQTACTTFIAPKPGSVEAVAIP